LASKVIELTFDIVMNPSEFTIVSWISALTGEQSIDDISTSFMV
jgi:hypothetical protein